MDQRQLWQRYRQYLCDCPSLGLSLDISRMDFTDDYFQLMQPAMARAYQAMADLESGRIANPDENRMVGHYWLRAAELAPQPVIRTQITDTFQAIQTFASEVHHQAMKPPSGSRFTDLLVIGIGGSALGPQLLADALGFKRDRLRIHFLDNTDPDGFDRLLQTLGSRLRSTLVLVISKSGSTKETRNGMVEVEHAFRTRGLSFPAQAVAVTGEGSTLDQLAREQGWLRRFPMWDWVGGRTSVMSAVGLLPAALQGMDIQGFIEGAAEMDRITRQHNTTSNPAALLALMWHHATNGRGAKDMVILPYKDRLLLLSRYLQQLVMESLGKEKDLTGQVVEQGLTVYGNKGSTDQHAYVQQLRDGVHNFFVTFLVVQEDRTPSAARKAAEVEPGVTSGDYLNGFWQGTRQALFDKGRQSMTICLEKLHARSLGALIALFERAVGFYASLVNINAYHQPGVEAGKLAAQAVLALQHRVIAHLKQTGKPLTIEQLAEQLELPHQVETIHHILQHLAANRRGIIHNRDRYRFRDRHPRG